MVQYPELFLCGRGSRGGSLAAHLLDIQIARSRRRLPLSTPGLFRITRRPRTQPARWLPGRPGRLARSIDPTRNLTCPELLTVRLYKLSGLGRTSSRAIEGSAMKTGQPRAESYESPQLQVSESCSSLSDYEDPPPSLQKPNQRTFRKGGVIDRCARRLR